MRDPRRVLPASLLALAVVGAVLGGCGGAEEEAPAAAEPTSADPDPAAVACREKWRDLAEEVGDRPEDEHPSTLAGRWTSIAATIDYYAVGASAADCEETLARQTAQLGQVERLSASLRRYDVAYQHDRLVDDATAYAPPAGRRKGEKAPSRRAVRRALTTLEQRAPRAERDQEAGWQQATAIDPTDARARRKARKDLAFLSGESAAWRQARVAQQTIERALRAARR